MKPILFNTEMVRAILDDRKTVTRLVVEPQPNVDHKFFECTDSNPIIAVEGTADAVNRYDPPYQPGDILYVLEAWSLFFGTYLYKADLTPDMQDEWEWKWKWRPSIHMPKEAARIFLRVKDVRVERLQDIRPVDVVNE